LTTLVPQRWRADASGFTLIELMIAVAIVAILSSIAVPNYTAYVMRGKITEATSRLAVKQVQMEQFFQDNRTYVAGTACTSDTTSSKYFDFSCTGAGAPSATTFIISAVGKDSMAGFGFTINQSGAMTTGAVPTGWTAPSPNNCWVTKKGGIC
jgi:type IV pilus assembly protein PilE